jgi:hypothetical protein
MNVTSISSPVVVVRRHPRRLQISQTQIDQARCNERRRNNAELFDGMMQILTRMAGGNLTKSALMGFAEKIAEWKKIKIDREAKRMKDCRFAGSARTQATFCWQHRITRKARPNKRIFRDWTSTTLTSPRCSPTRNPYGCPTHTRKTATH